MGDRAAADAGGAGMTSEKKDRLMVLRYIRRRWRRISQLWRPHHKSTIPYFVVRDHVEAGYERRALLIDTIVDIAIIMSIGIALDPNLRQPPLWTAIIGGILAYLLLVGISFTASLTAEAMSFTNESQRVEECLEFLRRQQYSRQTIDDITAIAALNSGSVQNKLPLPTVILTVIATVVVIQQFSLGIWFILGLMALLSLLNFATTTGEVHADQIIQKAAVLVLRDYEQQRRKPPEQFLDQILDTELGPSNTGATALQAHTNPLQGAP